MLGAPVCPAARRKNKRMYKVTLILKRRCSTDSVGTGGGAWGGGDAAYCKRRVGLGCVTAGVARRWRPL